MASRLVQTVGPGRPCDLHFETCMNSTEVMSLLQPKPIAVRPREDEPPAKRPRNERLAMKRDSRTDLRKVEENAKERTNRTNS